MNKMKNQLLSKIGNPDWTPNWTIGGIDWFAEIRQNSTGEVWLCQRPISKEAFGKLQLPEGFSITGIGKAAHDVAYFRRSPGAKVDGSLDTLEIEGYTFSRVAKPGMLESGFVDVIVLPVYKYHILQFNAGRTIEILTMEDGQNYVPNVTELSGMFHKTTKERVLPEGWTIRKEILKQDLIVEIPCPARVCFFRSGHGFHGPVEIQKNNK